MNEILERVNELNEVLNNGYGIPNMEWVKRKVVELQNIVNTPAVNKCVSLEGRELLLDFLNWFDQPIRLITHDDLIDEYMKDKSSNCC